jgi:hypothetical protein
MVIEAAGGGTDSVNSSITYTLGAELENLVLSGTATINGTGNNLNNSITGNALNNVLTGLDGNDYLNGGLGTDTMDGGAGNDTYTVDNVGDVVIEAAGGGTDTVNSSLDYSLVGTELENLILSGTVAINATGNSLNNSITGNALNNVLTGLEGNDVLNGGLGNDSLDGGNGIDTASYTYLSATNNVTVALDETGGSIATVTSGVIVTETDILTSIENLTGGAGNDTLTGNSGANVLNGYLGADTLTGGAGNDTYYVDNAGDVVIEVAGGGTDTVNSSLDYSLLNTELENLTLSGTAAINATGNTLNNVLIGNANANNLNGGEGADTLIGGLGQDSYTLTETIAATDTVRIAVGDSLVGSYDKATGFTLGTGTINTVGVDKLDLVSTLIAANTAAVNGVDSGTILSHSINNGIISFDDINNYTSPLTVTAATNLADVFSYLQANITGGNTVAFVEEGNTFVFQDGGVTDTLVELVGVVANSVNTTGLTTGSVWIA